MVIALKIYMKQCQVFLKITNVILTNRTNFHVGGILFIIWMLDKQFRGGAIKLLKNLGRYESSLDFLRYKAHSKK